MAITNSRLVELLVRRTQRNEEGHWVYEKGRETMLFCWAASDEISEFAIAAQEASDIWMFKWRWAARASQRVESTVELAVEKVTLRARDAGTAAQPRQESLVTIKAGDHWSGRHGFEIVGKKPHVIRVDVAGLFEVPGVSKSLDRMFELV